MANGKSKLFATALVACAAAAPAHAALTISKSATSNVTCTHAVCSATAADAVLDVAVLKKALKRGDLVVRGGTATDIVVAAELSWTTASRLTLDAQDSITFTKPVTAEGTGAVTLVTETPTGSRGADLAFTDPGRLAFWDTASSLVINGQTYTLSSDLHSLAAHVAADPSGYHALAANVDADKDGPYEGAAVTTGFHGVFDGLGHSIANFHIYVHKYHHYLYAGLFLKVGGAEIRNLDLTGFTGATDDQSDWGDNARKRKFPILGLGPIAGSVETSTVRNCSASGSIFLYNSDNGGGLVGAASQSTINHSHASTAVTGYQGIVGGLVATTAATTIRGSYASGAVSTVGAAGGLVGEADGAIRNSYATGTVTTHYTGGGGLVGLLTGVIDSSFATGDVQGGNAQIGGLVGRSTGGAIGNSYATGALSGDTVTAGGLVGTQDAMATLATSYATGQLPVAAQNETGGVIGDDVNGTKGRPRGTNTNAYWDLGTSGVSDPGQGAGNFADDPGLTGLTTAQLQSGLPAGFDPAIWGLSASVDGGYPYLLANPPQQQGAK